MQTKILKICDRIAGPSLVPLFELQKEIVNMLPILLMIALYLWLVGVGIAAYVLLRNYYRLSGPDPPQDGTSRKDAELVLQMDDQGTHLPDAQWHIARKFPPIH
jgi:hypothetical protein